MILGLTPAGRSAIASRGSRRSVVVVPQQWRFSRDLSSPWVADQAGDKSAGGRRFSASCRFLTHTRLLGLVVPGRLAASVSR